MTLLHLMLDGALAAAELFALLFVTPAAARESAAIDAPAALERPVQLHRLSTSADMRLLGSLADVRAAQAVRNDRSGRVLLLARTEADAPRAMLLDEDDGPFLLITPHRAVHRGTLVLRPSSGDPETLHLGALDLRHAVLVPLQGRAHLDRLADGAVELELVDDRGTQWITLVAERVDAPPAAQVRSGE
ncbi:MAG: hypothetical protein ACM3O5_06760 [Betaproteobacteria bacterium]